MAKMNSKKGRITAGILLALLVFSQLPAANSLAQTSGLDWSDPINVSQSGGTTFSVLARDSSDNIHVFWEDTFADQGYALWNGAEWSPAVAAQFEFAEVTPRLLNDENGNLFAFWIDPVGALLFSSAVAANAGSANAWTSPQTIADEVIAFSAATGNQGNLYVAYVIGLSVDGTSAGVYARAYLSGGGGWQAETILYPSKYYRSLTVSTAHVNISVNKGAEQDTLYIAWDDTPLKRVYLVKSSDEGETWSEPIEIDGPKAGEVPPGPFNINTYAYGENLLVLWQTNLQSAYDCTQRYRFSSDFGETWEASDVMFENLVGCPQSIDLFPGPDGMVMLMTMIQDTSYLVAWDGLAWSEPQPQPILNSFSDPVSDTLVKLGCIHPVVTSQNQLFVAGCDTAGNGDTWVLSRFLGTKLDWFPLDSSWTLPTSIQSTTRAVDNLQVVADDKDVFHAVWREYSTPMDAQGNDKLFYAQFDGKTWSAPVEILKPPDKNIGEVFLAYSQDGFLYLTWSGRTQGQIYFSWANSDKAVSKFEWSDAVVLPTQGIVTSPSISEGVDGELLISYVIPVNENRGVYSIQSTDKGATWSEPALIFNAGEAGWEMVGEPFLVEYAQNRRVAIWTKNSILTSPSPVGLYSSSSQDGGMSWTPAQAVDEKLLHAVWLERTGAGILHRLWEGDRYQNPGVWHEISSDGGVTWQRAIPISILGEVGAAAVTPDTTGHLHIFQSFRTDLKQPMVVHLWWNGSVWETGETLQYPKFNQQPAQELAAAVDKQGKILLLILEERVDPTTQTTTHELLYSTRVFEAAPVELTPSLDVDLPVAPAIPTIAATPVSNEPAPTQAPATTVSNLDTSEPNTSNSQVIIFAVVISVIFILGGIFVILRK